MESLLIRETPETPEKPGVVPETSGSEGLQHGPHFNCIPSDVFVQSNVEDHLQLLFH